jgi:hypothetical protein
MNDVILDQWSAGDDASPRPEDGPNFLEFVGARLQRHNRETQLPRATNASILERHDQVVSHLIKKTLTSSFFIKRKEVPRARARVQVFLIWVTVASCWRRPSGKLQKVNGMIF